MAVDLRGELFAAFAQYGADVGARDALLIVTTPGTRTPGAENAGTNPTTVEHECLALIEESANSTVEGSLVRQRDALISIFGASLPDGVMPRANDRIRIEDTDGAIRTFVVLGEKLPSAEAVGVEGDSVGAMYRCPCRA